MRLKLGILAVLAALLAAGCGGGGAQQTATGAASVVPKGVAAVVSVDTNLNSTAWINAQALLDTFPGKEELLSSLRSSLQNAGLDWETDVKPALGDKIDIVWLDFRNKGNNLVGLTKPKDTAKFDALLEKSSTAHEDVEGWTVFASDQAELTRFDQMRSANGTLSDDSVYTDAVSGLPSDAIATAFVDGGPIRSALGQALSSSGLPSGTAIPQLGNLESIGSAATPESDGVRLEANLNGDLGTGSGYHAELPGVLPSGAALYLSFHELGGNLEKVLDSYSNTHPNFAQQLAQVETALGISVDNVFALLGGEGALVLYPSTTATPGVLVAFRVSDESAAQTLIQKAGAFAKLSGTMTAKQVQIGSTQATEFDFSDGTIVYAAAFNGNVAITNSRAAISGMQGSGSKLADDPVYEAAVSGAGLPNDTNGFLYVNLQTGLPLLLNYVQKSGTKIPKTVRDNLAPLQSVLLYSAKSGNGLQLSGFLGIR